MFFARRPSERAMHRLIASWRHLPLTSGAPGILTSRLDLPLDEATVVLGHGPDTLARARTALECWRQFDIGWVEVHPRAASIEVGTVVGVLIRHLGFWSLNGCRVIYHQHADASAFGYAYATLPTHAEAGEELFEVAMHPTSGEVTYRIRAVSWPYAWIATAGQPIVRALQARFRRDSMRAMVRAVAAAGAHPCHNRQP